jgi:hypothetical protein
MTEPQDPLQALLEKEFKARKAILDPTVTEVDTYGFSMSQLGLELALIGKDGRIWGHLNDKGKLEMVFDPKGTNK